MTVTAVIKFDDGSTVTYEQNVNLKQFPLMKPHCQSALNSLFERLKRDGKDGGAPLRDLRRFNGNHVTGKGRHGGPKAVEIISVDYGDE